MVSAGEDGYLLFVMSNVGLCGQNTALVFGFRKTGVMIENHDHDLSLEILRKRSRG